MDVATGKLVSSSGLPNGFITTFDYDPVHSQIVGIWVSFPAGKSSGGGRGSAAAGADSATAGVAAPTRTAASSSIHTPDKEHFGTLDLSGDTITTAPVGRLSPYWSKGYTQVNAGVVGGGTFFVTACNKKGRLFLVGASVTTGELTFEIEHDLAMIDMLYYQ
jgi:hypothetical protein